MGTCIHFDGVSDSLIIEGENKRLGKGQILDLEGRKQFPNLDALIGGYFRQDYSIDGNTLEEVTEAFKTNNLPGLWQGARAEIERFLAERPDNERVTQDFESYFLPGVLAEGWQPALTNWRQWLTRVAELLVETPNAINR